MIPALLSTIMTHLRLLGADDEPVAERFLSAHAETTMILRSNLLRGGIVDHGKTFQGTYVGAFVGDALEGVAALYWNGNVVLAGGSYVTALVEMLGERAPGGFRGILGTAREVAEAQTWAAVRFGVPIRKEHHEILYALSLVDLVVPGALSRLTARTPRDDETSLVLDWRMAYVAELSDVRDTPEERVRQTELVDAFHREAHDVLLFDGDTPVAYSGFNAEVADMVQVGGVFTPPSLRGRGYARAAVAASLVAARSRGAHRAILFTGNDNLPAQRAYVSLGFRPIGDYALVIYG
jgi:uncharacterized protein